MQRDIDAHLALDVVLDGVQNLVVLKRVALAGHVLFGAALEVRGLEQGNKQKGLACQLRVDQRPLCDRELDQV